ncbi:MAG: hypothetical protein ABSG73_13185 [Candidatus Aminicenantales bacterium]|jgi:hypothetical protein
MSAERLSRLQKWILEDVYIGGNQVALITGSPSVWRRSIYLRAWEDGIFHPDQNETSAKVIFSRSIWGLIEKKYLQGLGPTSVEKLIVKHARETDSQEELRAKMEKHFKETIFFSASEDTVAPAERGLVQAKVLSLTLKGRAKAKQLLAASEALKVNSDKLAISLGEGSATVAPEKP